MLALGRRHRHAGIVGPDIRPCLREADREAGMPLAAEHRFEGRRHLLVEDVGVEAPACARRRALRSRAGSPGRRSTWTCSPAAGTAGARTRPPRARPPPGPSPRCRTPRRRRRARRRAGRPARRSRCRRRNERRAERAASRAKTETRASAARRCRRGPARARAFRAKTVSAPPDPRSAARTRSPSSASAVTSTPFSTATPATRRTHRRYSSQSSRATLCSDAQAAAPYCASYQTGR